MFVTFLTWFGGYVLIGIVVTLLLQHEPIIELIKSPDERDFEELSSMALMVMFGWPLVLPIVGYLTVADKIVDRFSKKVNSSFGSKKKLINFLIYISAISEDTGEIAIMELDERRHSTILKKRKKFKLS